MIGLLQIITYLLCIHLIYKGFEILQISLTRENKEQGNTTHYIGLGAVILALILAVVFATWADKQAEAISEGMKRLEQTFNP